MDPLAIALGSALVVFGVVLIVWRRAISDFMRTNQREFFGKAGQRVARKSAAKTYLVLGPFGILIGACILVGGLLAHR
jgi:hypothetical protein